MQVIFNKVQSLLSSKPIAYWPHKLNPVQTLYTTLEREVISIVKALNEFRNVLLGH
jgi:hypothetical protein